MSDDQMLPEDTQDLRTAFQNRAVLEIPTECPPSDKIYAAVAGELSGEETLAIVDHLADCPACAQAWQLASGLQQAEEEEKKEREDFAQAAIPSNVVTLKPRLVARAAPLAAAAVLLLGVGITLVNVDRNPEVRYRGGPVVEGVGAAPTYSQNDSVLMFHWDMSFKPRSVTLNIYDVDLNLIHTVSHAEEHFVVPLQNIDGLTESIFWQIEAELDSGATMRSDTSSSVVVLQ